jgi:hypothetical protein
MQNSGRWFSVTDISEIFRSYRKLRSIYFHVDIYLINCLENVIAKNISSIYNDECDLFCKIWGFHCPDHE